MVKRIQRGHLDFHARNMSKKKVFFVQKWCNGDVISVYWGKDVFLLIIATSNPHAGSTRGDQVELRTLSDSRLNQLSSDSHATPMEAPGPFKAFQMMSMMGLPTSPALLSLHHNVTSCFVPAVRMGEDDRTLCNLGYGCWVICIAFLLFP